MNLTMKRKSLKLKLDKVKNEMNVRNSQGLPTTSSNNNNNNNNNNKELLNEWNSLPTIHRAIYRKYSVKELEKLIENDGNLFDYDHQRRTCLHVAIEESSSDEVINWILRKGLRINAKERLHLATPLHLACRMNNVDGVRCLIQCSVDVALNGEQSNYPKTSLIDFSARDDMMRTCAHICALNTNSVECLKLILESSNIVLEQNDQNGMLPFHLATLNGSIDVIRYLMTYNPNGEQFIQMDNSNNTPLHLAAWNGNVEMIRCLFADENELIVKSLIMRNSFGYNPIHISIIHQYGDVTNLLLKYYDVYYSSMPSFTPLSLESPENDQTISITSNIDINDLLTDDGLSLLHLITLNYSNRFLEKLQEENSEIDEINQKEYNPFELSSDNCEMMDKYENMILHYISFSTTDAIFEEEQMRDVNSSHSIESSTGSLFHFIISKLSKLKILKKCLLHHNRNGFNPILLAVANGNLKMMDHLLKILNVLLLSNTDDDDDDGDDDGIDLIDKALTNSLTNENILHVAVNFHHIHIVKYVCGELMSGDIELDNRLLIKFQCLLSEFCFQGFLPIHISILQLDVELLDYLLHYMFSHLDTTDRDIDILFPDNSDRTILHVAAVTGDMNCMDRMREYLLNLMKDERFSLTFWDVFSRQDICENTFLHYAIGKFEEFDYILQRFLELLESTPQLKELIKLKNCHGTTVYSLASYFDTSDGYLLDYFHFHVNELMLERDVRGRSPLHYAVFSDNVAFYYHLKRMYFGNNFNSIIFHLLSIEGDVSPFHLMAILDNDALLKLITSECSIDFSKYIMSNRMSLTSIPVNLVDLNNTGMECSLMTSAFELSILVNSITVSLFFFQFMSRWISDNSFLANRYEIVEEDAYNLLHFISFNGSPQLLSEYNTFPSLQMKFNHILSTDQFGRTPFILACECQHPIEFYEKYLEMINQFEENNKSTIKISEIISDDNANSSSLFRAVILSNEDLSNFLLYHHPSLLLQRDNNGRTLLHYAFLTQSNLPISIIERWCEEVESMKVSLNDHNNISPFICLLRNKHLREDKQIVNFLSELLEKFKFLQNHLLINHQSSSSSSSTKLELHESCLLNDNDMFDLFRKYVQSTNLLQIKDEKGRSILHSATINGNVEQFKKLSGQFMKEKDVDDDKDNFGRTYLMHSLYKNHKELTQYLLEENANPFLQDNSGNTSLHYSVEYGEDEFLSIFLIMNCVKHISSYSETKTQILPNSQRTSLWNYLSCLLSLSRSSDGKTPLHIATERNLPRVVRELVRCGSNIWAIDKKNRIPLHCCGIGEELTNEEKVKCQSIVRRLTDAIVYQSTVASMRMKCVKSKDNQPLFDGEEEDDIRRMMEYFPNYFQQIYFILGNQNKNGISHDCFDNDLMITNSSFIFDESF
ncbi:hypothetical protein SNEBB_009466 [Seison nebaliae]|nr:hypothetical protein SNEBB_009466 [Seison nebaliae]